MEWHVVEGDGTEEHEQCTAIRNHGDGTSSGDKAVHALV